MLSGQQVGLDGTLVGVVACILVRMFQLEVCLFGFEDAVGFGLCESEFLRSLLESGFAADAIGFELAHPDAKRSDTRTHFVTAWTIDNDDDLAFYSLVSEASGEI